MMARVRHAWPPGIRTQLTLLYTGVFALLFLLSGGGYYAYLQNALGQTFDTALHAQTAQIASGISYDHGTICIQDVTGDLPGLQNTCGPSASDGSTVGAGTGSATGAQDPDVNFGALVRIVNAQGKTVYASPKFGELHVPPASIAQPLHQDAVWTQTITASNGADVRLYSAPLTQDGHVYGVLQVGEPLASLFQTLRSVALTLLGIAPFVLIFSALGSYWLAGRAFRPIARLSRIARGIEAEDLHQRVPVPPAHDEVRELALTLNAMIARLDRAFSQQRRFVADASHELRTPVAAIRNLTDVALTDEGASSEEFAATLREVNGIAERLGVLINDLLALARADEGHLRLEREPVRLDVLADETAAVMEPLADERGLVLDVQTPASVTVIGDEARLIQVCMNLLDNAIRYTPSGGQVDIGVATRDGVACLSVRDTGIGISEEERQHIFERFYRADEARTRVASGNGLGLSIVEQIVRAHGGSVAVESAPGKGSTFTILLPLAPEQELPPPPPSRPGDAQEAISALS